MLEFAGEESGYSSMNMFVGGRTDSKRLVLFDPMRDAESVDSTDFVISWDIDSINTTAHKLHVTGDVDIEVLPYSGRKPPHTRSITPMWSF